VFSAKRRLQRLKSVITKWTGRKYFILPFWDVEDIFKSVLKYVAPHKLEAVVHDKDATAYLQALDDAYDKAQKQGKHQEHASRDNRYILTSCVTSYFFRLFNHFAICAILTLLSMQMPPCFS
jgi:hypothetical protein